MMQNSTTSHTGNIMMNFFDKRDLEAASILLELCHPVVFESKPYKPTTWVWMTRKNRSIPRDPPPPPQPAGNTGIAGASTDVTPPPPTQKGDAAGSPVTPLSFAPSESDDKSEDLKKKVSGTKRKREESVETRDISSSQNEVLDVENLAMKKQLTLAQVKPHPHERREHCPQQNLTAAHQQPPLIAHHTPPPYSAPIMGFSYHLGGQRMLFQANCCRLGSNRTHDNVRAPLGIDLNAPAPETFCHSEDPKPSRLLVANVWPIEPKSEKAIAAAEARRKRMEICRAKRASRALSHKPSSSRRRRRIQ